jgi:hypothetical protein
MEAEKCGEPIGAALACAVLGAKAPASALKMSGTAGLEIVFEHNVDGGDFQGVRPPAWIVKVSLPTGPF